MCPDIMWKISGSKLVQLPGILKGFSRRVVKGELYPAIIADSENCVQGIVYTDVSESAWSRLDDFEGEMYDRRRVTIELLSGTAILADAYICKHAFLHCLDAKDWDFEEFVKKGKAGFLL